MITHRNAALSFEARRRLVQRCQHRPIAHVAAEAGVSRACLSKWVNRYRRWGEDGLLDRSSRPHHHPHQLDPALVALVEDLRRTRKWSARLIAAELADQGHQVSVATIGRWLVRLGLNQRRWLDTDGNPTRDQPPGRITARYPGHMVHMDVKKVAQIRDGGGWRVHGRGSEADRERHRTRIGYTYLHSVIDGFTRLAYTEALPDERGTTVLGFWNRARAWLALHGITRITRLVTDNAMGYRATALARCLAGQGIQHQFTRPYTPRHNGKAERYNRILAEEVLYARPYTSEADRTQAVTRWNAHYNYHRPHTACHDQPPATRTPTRVTNVMRSNN